jgi:putative endonuclease
MFVAAFQHVLARLRAVLGSDADPRKRVGREGETIAARHLASQGYRIIERNVRVPMGEADIVAMDPDGLTHVIVEVKTRVRIEGQPELSATTLPEESVTVAKRQTLENILKHLSRANAWERSRIDVIGIELSGEDALVRHHVGEARSRAVVERNAFR